MWLSKSLKSQNSNSILLISSLSAFRFLSCFTEMSRRMSFMNHINFRLLCVETAEYLVFKFGLIFSFLCTKHQFFLSKIKSFKNFNSKTICLIFLKIAQKCLNMFVSILIKFDLILLNSFLTLGIKVVSSTSTLGDQLHHHKFHVNLQQCIVP